MQIKKIAALCALACAGMSSPAFAAMPSDLDAAIEAGRVISISGASAVQKGFTGIISQMFEGTPAYFAEKAADISGTDFVGVAGTLKDGHGAWSNQTVVIVYRVLGGSVYGVNSVAKADEIEALKVSSACTGSAGTAAAPYVCGTQFIAPDAGVSDVAPPLFQAPFNTEGETAAPSLTADELGVLTSTPLYGVGFGVALTNTVSANVKLNRAAIAAIMAGNVGTWDAVDSSESGDIVMCRRVPGSGTQAVYNMYFGNFPCDASGAATNPPADRYASGAWDDEARAYTVNGNTGGLVVVENSSSGELRNCLEKAVDASKVTTGGYTTYDTFDRDGKKVTVKFKNGVQHKAIGLLSLDSLGKSTTTSKWQFRALDGAGKFTQASSSVEPVASGTAGRYPTIDNIVDGTWDLMGMVSFNVPARTTGDKLDVLNAFVAAAQNPQTLNDVSSLKYVAAGVPGSDATVGKVLRASYVGGNQCAPYNRNN